MEVEDPLLKLSRIVVVVVFSSSYVVYLRLLTPFPSPQLNCGPVRLLAAELVVGGDGVSPPFSEGPSGYQPARQGAPPTAGGALSHQPGRQGAPPTARGQLEWLLFGVLVVLIGHLAPP